MRVAMKSSCWTREVEASPKSEMPSRALTRIAHCMASCDTGEGMSLSNICQKTALDLYKVSFFFHAHSLIGGRSAMSCDAMRRDANHGLLICPQTSSSCCTLHRRLRTILPLRCHIRDFYRCRVKRYEAICRLFFARRIWIHSILYELPKTTVDGNRRRGGSGGTTVVEATVHRIGTGWRTAANTWRQIYNYRRGQIKF